MILTLEELKQEIDILREKRKSISKEIKILTNRYFARKSKNRKI